MLFLVNPSVGQTPKVQLYFDSNLTQWNKSCPGFVVDSLFVVAENFPEDLVQIEYSISYPPALAWIGDVVSSGNTVGSTPTGITHNWTAPAPASSQVVLARVLVMWQCDYCDSYVLGSHVCANAHPGSGSLRALGAEHGQWIFAEGWGANVCPPMCGEGVCPPWLCEPIPTVPVQATTWGAVKELYR
jgi:hypothetical protein